jgi:SAM-dependent methyltransferase
VAAVMRDTGAEVVDLVPPDLPADRALQLLRRIDQQRLRDDPLHWPGGAHEAVALHPSLAARLPAAEAPDDRGALARRTMETQRYAPGRCELRLAPHLRATAWRPAESWRELEELTAFSRPFMALAPGLVALDTAWLLGLAVGALLAPPAGLAAMAAWSAQPILVFGGGRDRTEPGAEPSLRPPGLLRSSLLRFSRTWADNVRLGRAGWQIGRAAAARRHEVAMPGPLAQETLFEPRRETCPWCDGASLVGRLDVPDLIQNKPGLFHLDQCRACGHVFQNPALSLAGLDYYYDQFYDGVSHEAVDVGFTHTVASYRGRVEAMGRITTPRRWLDVGAGYGHFCLTARRRWPDATFDGLDLSDGIEEGQRRGWVDTGHRGLFPDLADGLSGTYDVVSMHHYLEHTREPRAELAAAAKVLQPGGHLMIEVPDPEAPWAARLGPYWSGWFQPQHQHLMPCDNLATALAESGFEVVAVERGPASMRAELTCAVMLGVHRLSRSPHVPWLPPASPTQRAARLGVLAAALPALAVSLVADRVMEARLGPDDIGNAYRVVARRI